MVHWIQWDSNFGLPNCQTAIVKQSEVIPKGLLERQNYYFIVLCCIALYCIALHCIVQYYIMLHYITLL